MSREWWSWRGGFSVRSPPWQSHLVGVRGGGPAQRVLGRRHLGRPRRVLGRVGGGGGREGRLGREQRFRSVVARGLVLLGRRRGGRRRKRAPQLGHLAGVSFRHRLGFGAPLRVPLAQRVVERARVRLVQRGGGLADGLLRESDLGPQDGQLALGGVGDVVGRGERAPQDVLPLLRLPQLGVHVRHPPLQRGRVRGPGGAGSRRREHGHGRGRGLHRGPAMYITCVFRGGRLIQ